MKNSLTEQLTALPLFWVALAFIDGIVLASQIRPLPLEVWAALAAVSVAFGILFAFLRPQVRLLLVILPAFVFLGGARYQIAQPLTVITPDQIAYYNKLIPARRIYVTGTLVEPPDVRDTYISLRLQVEKVDSGEGDKDVSGLLLVRLSNEYTLRYGDHVRVRGLVEAPPDGEEFSYREYLAMQGIHSILKTSDITIIPFGSEKNPYPDLMFRLRNSLVKRLYQLFPDPEASLLSGVLFGVDKNIPAELQQAFKNTGTAHIVAISGFNIAIIAGIFVSIFSRLFGKKIGALLAILGIFGYAVFVGADASVVRAAIMGTLSIIAAQFGRRNMALNALTITALVMALIDPYILWDVGFQLSFGATLGLVLYAQWMQDGVSAFLTRFLPTDAVEKIIGPLSDFFLLTLAAQLTTLPITAYHFGRISLSSIITNPFILPAQPPVMILGGLAVLLGRLYMPLGQVLAWIAWPFLAYTIRMVEFFGGLAGGVWILDEFNLLFVIFFYLILFGLTLAGSGFRKFFTPSVIIAALAVLTILTWRSVVDQPDGRLHVTFLDVGSADGVLIKTPAGRHILINGGPSPSQLSDQLGRRFPPFGREMDYLIIASTQENQVAALPRTLERFPPANVLWAGNGQASFSAENLDKWLTSQKIPVTVIHAGTNLDLGEGGRLRVLAVSPRGAVVLVEWGALRLLLPIGVDFDTFAELDNGKNLGQVTALLITESGYGPANPPDWLENVQPQMVVVSVGAGDPDGLPDAELLKRLENITTLRTDVQGWIEFTTDGNQVWITAERAAEK